MLKNNMITEDYVTFGTAKLLKEKGFNEATFYDYNERGIRWFEEVLVNHNSQGGIACPTLQMAMKWLRKVYNVVIEVCPLSFTLKGSKSFICDNWVFSLWVNGNPIVSEFYGNQIAYLTYEEACESAIKCGLENLI